MELKKVIKIVTDKYKKEKYIAPVVIIESTTNKSKVGILPLDLSSHELKDQYKKLCSKVIHNIKPKKYFFVSEAISHTDDKDHIDIKKEPYNETENDCLVIAEYRSDMKIKVVQINIKNKKLGKPQYFKDIMSSDEWNFYLEK